MRKAKRLILVGVTALAALLGGLVLVGARMILPFLWSSWDSSLVARARSDLLTLSMAVDDYAIRNAGACPDALVDLTRPDRHGVVHLTMPSALVDPRGRPYVYVRPTRSAPAEVRDVSALYPYGQPDVYVPPATGTKVKFDVLTYGRDGLPGGTGLDADISYKAILAGK